MKKTINIAVLTLFLLSLLPLSMADSENGNGEQNQVKEQNQIEEENEAGNNDSIGIQERDRERLRERLEDLKEDGKQLSETLRGRLQEIKEKRLKAWEEMAEKPEWAKFNETKGFKARVITAVQAETARANYIRARERFTIAKMELEQAKLRFQERQRLREMCEDLENCNITEEDMIESAKNFLGNSADAIIEHLNKVKSKIEENDDLTEEEAQEMIEKIDAKIAEIQAAKEQAQNATTKEEIREAAQKINAAWKNIKQLTHVHANALINARIGGIVVKSEQLKEKLERILARMEENNKSIEDIQPLIDEYEAKLKLAQEEYEAAVQKYREFWAAEDKPEAKDKLEEAKQLMEEAKEALKEANEKLREIIKAIKEANGEQEIEEENEEEDEDEEEEENEGNETS
ncbi:MAG: hypothetical protein ABIH63_02330 [archaeon]